MIVVGAGPAGLLCAKEAASLGAKVTVYEEHKEVGEPVKCTGLISKKGLDKLAVGYEDSVLNECRGARFYSPNGTELEVKKSGPVALVVDRAVLDKAIAEEAQSEGVEIITGKKWEGKCDVAADGPLSKWGPKRQYVHAYQVTADLEKETDFVEIHWTPEFFAWVVPVNNKECRVGIGVRTGRWPEGNAMAPGNPKEALMKWLHSKKMELEYDNEASALIPLFDNSPAVVDGTCLVGDAAAHVKATTGGGVAIGGFNARICGAVLGENRKPADYEALWREEYGKDLGMHRRIRNMLDKIPPSEMDGLFELANSEGLAKTIERHGDMERPWPLLNALMQKPGLAMKMMKYAKYLQ
ncbi:NAD(P)-binding protein [archaeon]